MAFDDAILRYGKPVSPGICCIVQIPVGKYQAAFVTVWQRDGMVARTVGMSMDQDIGASLHNNGFYRIWIDIHDLGGFPLVDFGTVFPGVGDNRPAP